MSTYGHVLAVFTRPVGDELEAAASMNDTVLELGDTGDFSETGGYLTIGGTILEYSSTDDDASTLTLVDPLAEAFPVDTDVYVYPPSFTKTAVVEIDQWDEPEEATVPQRLWDKMPDGIRTLSSQEVVPLRTVDDEWVVGDPENQKPEIQGDLIALKGGSIPVYDDEGIIRSLFGLQPDGTYANAYSNAPPPPAPSTPTADGSSGSLVVSSFGTTATGSAWPLDILRIDIHVGYVAGFTPTVATALGTFEPDVGGTFELSVPSNLAGMHYVKLVAVNTSFISGPPSGEIAVDVLDIQAVSVAMIQGEIDQIYATVEAGDSANSQAIDQEVTNRIADVNAARTTAANSDTVLDGRIDSAIADYNAQFAALDVGNRTESTSPPGATANEAGDIWEQYDTLAAGQTRRLIAAWVGEGGTSWVQKSLSPQYIPVLNVNTATVGTLGVNRLAIADFTNYVRDPRFKGIGSWVVNSGTPEIGVAITAGPGGGADTAVKFIASGAAQQVNESPGFAVAPGEILNLSVKGGWRVTQPNAGTIYAGVTFKDATGTTISTSYTITEAATTLSGGSSWTPYSGDVTAPAGAATAEPLVRISSTVTTGSNVYFTGFNIRRKFGGELVLDGSMKARHIDVVDLNASGEVVVGTSQVTGFDAAAQTATKNLWGLPTNTTLINGGNIATNTVLANSLAVADFTNYVSDPQFKGFPGGWIYSGNGAYIDPSFANKQGIANTGVLVLSPSGVYCDARSNLFPVQPGDTFSLTTDWLRNASANGQLYVRVYWYQASGANASTSYSDMILADSNNGQVTVYNNGVGSARAFSTGIWYTDTATSIVAPNDAAQARVIAIRSGAYTTGYWILDNMKLQRRYGGSVVIDGTLEAKHMKTDLLSSLIVRGDVLETSALASKGIKISNSGIIGYDNATGLERFVVNPTTGLVSMTGGTIQSANIYGSLVSGGTFETSSDSTANRVKITTASGSGTVQFYSGVSDETWPAQITGVDLSAGGSVPEFIFASGRATSAPNSSTMTLKAGTSSANTVASFNATQVFFGTAATQFAIGGTGESSLMVVGNIRSQGGNFGIYDESYTSGGTTNAQINNNGRIIRGTSSRELKKDITTLTPEDLAPLRTIRSVKFHWKDEDGMGSRWYAGHIAEELHDAGATLWVSYDKDGNPSGVHYPELVAGLIAMVQDLYERIEA